MTNRIEIYGTMVGAQFIPSGDDRRDSLVVYNLFPDNGDSEIQVLYWTSVESFASLQKTYESSVSDSVKVLVIGELRILRNSTHIESTYTKVLESMSPSLPRTPSPEFPSSMRTPSTVKPTESPARSVWSFDQAKDQGGQV